MGFYNWHDFDSNPKTIKLYVSKLGDLYEEWDTFNLSKKKGEQKFIFKNIKEKYFFKILISKNFGDKVTYMNNIYFYSHKKLNLKQSLLKRKF